MVGVDEKTGRAGISGLGEAAAASSLLAILELPLTLESLVPATSVETLEPPSVESLATVPSLGELVPGPAPAGLPPPPAPSLPPPSFSWQV